MRICVRIHICACIYALSCFCKRKNLMKHPRACGIEAWVYPACIHNKYGRCCVFLTFAQLVCVFIGAAIRVKRNLLKRDCTLIYTACPHHVSNRLFALASSVFLITEVDAYARAFTKCVFAFCMRACILVFARKRPRALAHICICSRQCILHHSCVELFPGFGIVLLPGVEAPVFVHDMGG